MTVKQRIYQLIEALPEQEAESLLGHLEKSPVLNSQTHQSDQEERKQRFAPLGVL